MQNSEIVIGLITLNKLSVKILFSLNCNEILTIFVVVFEFWSEKNLFVDIICNFLSILSN